MNYGGIPANLSDRQKSKITVIPVPYDETSTWIKGADKGPDAILEASANMELYDIETNSEVYLKGIYTAPAVTEKESPEKMVAAVKKVVSQHLEEDKFIVLLGGEHSVSIGSIQAFAEKFENLSILQIDAHSDLRNEYEGSKNNHACVMARARELCPIVQVGIRASDVTELNSIEPSRVFYGYTLRNNPKWMEQAIEKLTENVYITIDLDAFDPSIMPSTGTPEPGGMLYWEVLDFIKLVNEKRNITGFDVVELCPNENNKAPDFLATKLIYQILSYKFSDQKA
jgi:agmatinase